MSTDYEYHQRNRNPVGARSVERTSLQREHRMTKDDADVIAKILKAVGRRVSFRYPGAEKHKSGHLKDRAVVRSNPGARGVPYWDVVDLIEFKGEKNPEWIRIGYYRKSKSRLQWGSQTTITEPVKTWKRLLVKAAKQKPWFRTLLQSVIVELNEL